MKHTDRHAGLIAARRMRLIFILGL